MTDSRPSRKAWHRPRNVLLAIGAIALAWGIRQAWWWATAEPAPVVDYAAQLEALASSHQPEGRDGWALFVEAASRVETVESSVVELDLADETVRPPGDYLPLDYSLVLRKTFDRAFLAPELLALDRLREEGVWDLLAEASACPRAMRPVAARSRLVLDVPLSRLTPLRALARARVASMRLAAVDGEREERIAAFEQALALVRAAASQPLLIDRLVGLAIASMTLEELRVELLESRIDAVTGRALLGAMDRQLRLPPMSMAIEAERLCTLDLIQIAFTDDGHGDGRLDAGMLDDLAMFPGGGGTGGAASITGRLGGLFLAGRKETTALANEMYDGLARNADLDPATRATSGFDESAFASRLTYRHVLLRQVAPALSRVYSGNDRVLGEIAATRMMIALETYRAIHGEPPDRLDDLVPEVLAEVPVDPANGAAFLYRRCETDAQGRDYMLYSTGLETTEGGAAPPGAGARSSGADRDPFAAGLDVLDVEPRRDEEDE